MVGHDQTPSKLQAVKEATWRHLAGGLNHVVEPVAMSAEADLWRGKIRDIARRAGVLPGDFINKPNGDVPELVEIFKAEAARMKTVVGKQNAQIARMEAQIDKLHAANGAQNKHLQKMTAEIRRLKAKLAQANRAAKATPAPEAEPVPGDNVLNAMPTEELLIQARQTTARLHHRDAILSAEMGLRLGVIGLILKARFDATKKRGQGTFKTYLAQHLGTSYSPVNRWMAVSSAYDATHVSLDTIEHFCAEHMPLSSETGVRLLKQKVVFYSQQNPT